MADSTSSWDRSAYDGGQVVTFADASQAAPPAALSRLDPSQPHHSPTLSTSSSCTMVGFQSGPPSSTAAAASWNLAVVGSSQNLRLISSKLVPNYSLPTALGMACNTMSPASQVQMQQLRQVQQLQMTQLLQQQHLQLHQMRHPPPPQQQSLMMMQQQQQQSGFGIAAPSLPGTPNAHDLSSAFYSNFPPATMNNLHQSPMQPQPLQSTQQPYYYGNGLNQSYQPVSQEPPGIRGSDQPYTLQLTRTSSVATSGTDDLAGLQLQLLPQQKQQLPAPPTAVQHLLQNLEQEQPEQQQQPPPSSFDAIFDFADSQPPPRNNNNHCLPVMSEEEEEDEGGDSAETAVSLESSPGEQNGTQQLQLQLQPQQQPQQVTSPHPLGEFFQYSTEVVNSYVPEVEVVDEGEQVMREWMANDEVPLCRYGCKNKKIAKPEYKRVHLKKYHYDVYFKHCNRKRTPVEILRECTLGPNRSGDRICLYCKSSSQSQDAMLDHLKDQHKTAFRKFEADHAAATALSRRRPGRKTRF